MTEWYTYCEWGIPVEVVLGRRQAIDRLLLGFPTSPKLQKQFGRYMEGNLPDLKTSVGVGEQTWEGRLERSITRCTGPGSAV